VVQLTNGMTGCWPSEAVGDRIVRRVEGQLASWLSLRICLSKARAGTLQLSRSMADRQLGDVLQQG
jgi:hypothetical protein